MLFFKKKVAWGGGGSITIPNYLRAYLQMKFSFHIDFFLKTVLKKTSFGCRMMTS